MYQKIVLPVDMNEEASWERALPTALAMCRTFGASLHIVTVLPDYRMPLVASFFPEGFSDKARQALSDAQHRFVDQHIPADIPTQCIIADGSPYAGIIRTANAVDADLIVMASHNKRKWADHLLGPNAEHVVHHAGISVMMVR